MTNEEMRPKAEMYIGLFEDLKTRMGDAWAAVAILQEISRDVRAEAIRAERQAVRTNMSEEPASPKQLEYLRDLGIKVLATGRRKVLTKQAASALIDQALAEEAAR